MTGVAAGPVDLDAASIPARHVGPDGLVAGVVQDVADGRVLMVGWLDVEALAATLGDGRRPLPLPVARPAVAEGRDVGQRPPAPLARARLRRRRAAHRRGPARPDVPPRTRSCFDPDGVPAPTSAPRTQGFAWLETLWATIAERAADAARRARTPSSCSTAASTWPGARSPRRRPRSCSPPRTTRRPRPRAPTGPRLRAAARRRGRRPRCTTRWCCSRSVAWSRESSSTLRARASRAVRNRRRSRPPERKPARVASDRSRRSARPRPRRSTGKSFQPASVVDARVVAARPSTIVTWGTNRRAAAVRAAATGRRRSSAWSAERRVGLDGRVEGVRPPAALERQRPWRVRATIPATTASTRRRSRGSANG